MSWKIEVASNAAASAWTDYTSVVDWTTMRIGGAASQIEIDTGSGFDLADDAGSVFIPSRRVWRVIEDATTPDTVLGRGRTVGKDLARGLMPVGDANEKDVSLVDNNAHFGGIGFAGTARPAETDHARIRFFLETHLQGQYRASTNLTDTYLSSASPVNLEKRTYADVQMADIISEILGLTGKECFVTVDDELFYAPQTSTIYAAGLSITDDGPNLTTSFPPIDPRAREDGTELFTGVRVRYSNRRVINVADATAETDFDRWRTTIVDDSIKTTADATKRANVVIAAQKDEEISYSCALLLRADQVHLVKKGQTLSFRSAAVGVLSPVTLRVKRLNWEIVGAGHYLAHLEIGFPRKMAPRTGGGSANPGTPTPIGPVPFVPGEASVGEFTGGVGSPAFGYEDPGGGADYFTEHGGSLIALENGAQYRIVLTQTSSFGSDGGTNFNFLATANLRISHGAEGGGAQGHATGNWLNPDTMAVSNIYPWETTGPWTVGKVYESPWRIWDGTDGQLCDFGFAATPLSGYWGFKWDGVCRIEKLGGAGAEEDDPVGSPAPGQPISDTVGGDGTIDPGSPTPFPYAPLSLVIFVNGVNMAAELTELDPDAGTYEFATAIPVGAEVTRYYLGASA